MDEDVFDAIVVGGGFAGLSAAYRLATAGRSVLLIERGSTCGAKNLTGGRIYSYALRALLGERWHEAPVQREVKREVLALLTETDAVSVESTLTSADQESYTVLARPLLAWLADQAEEAGAMIVTGTTVDSLIVRDGRVRGVRADGDELEARVVIDCEGINPLLLEREGLIRRLDPHAVAVGAKYVYRFGSAREVDRIFGVRPGEGTAVLGMGAVTHGVFGGVFCYANTDSVSLGLVLDSAEWKASGRPILDTAEALREHPALGRYVDGGELIEYGAHLVYEGGYDTLPAFSGDGWLVCGDAAGLCLNRGFTIRGMDYAVLSGIAAADTVIEATQAGDALPSAQALTAYGTRLEQSMLRDFRTTRGAHDWMSSTIDLFTVYPQLAVDAMAALYHVGPEPLTPVGTTLWRAARQVKKPVRTARTLLKGVRTL
ncbi:FAD-dependent oxidoreductase [Cellulomonas taurus]|uniref:FAD-dependent oxidoreductase n=1 Tax=Cellulomonas taurus TaxID=2729175 RepID=UPI00145E55D1|nr:FAD-dependent oxidoreductase [Cellulomonas taurus]